MMSLRKTGAKVFTIVIFGLIIISFAFFGVTDYLTGPQASTSVVEVEDTKVPRQDFERSLRLTMTRMQRLLSQNIGMEQARAYGLVDQVLNDLIGRALLEQLSRDMGLIVTEERLDEIVIDQDAFKNTAGVFDPLLFQQTLRTLGLSEGMLRAQMRRETHQDQIAGAVMDGIAAPGILADALYRYRSEQRIADYLILPRAGIEAPADPEEAALQAYYEERNSQFMAPEYREVTYIHLPVQAAAEQVIISDEALRATFEERREEYSVPERRQIQQFVMPDGAAAEQAAAKLAEGGDFADVAREVTGNDPVDLGSLTQTELLPEIAEAVFALAANQPSTPLESPLGWHLVQVTEIEPRKEAVFEEERDELRRELAESEALENLLIVSTELDESLSSGESLGQAASSLGLEAVRLAAIDPSGQDRSGTAIPDLPDPRLFLSEVFSLAEGEESPIIETDNGDYFVVRLDSVTAQAARPLEEVREEVLAAWREDEVDRQLRERAEALAERLGEAGDLAGIGESEGLTLAKTEPLRRSDTGGDKVPSPQLTELLFDAKLNGVVTAPSSDGYVVARVTEILPAEPGSDAEGVKALQEELSNTMRQDFLAQFSAALRSRYNVSVNRPLIDQLTGNI